ncbi:PAS domain-containing protein [Nocardioides dongxiaopingii]|nr:PAS domain-containing protein [Nocardioides sp. S-1144]
MGSSGLRSGTTITSSTSRADQAFTADLESSFDELGYLVGNEPSAVLLVDLSSRDVVHANAVARQLAPGLQLPSPLDVWSDAAGLRDLEGGLLSETTHPLSRLARTEPVNGQAVSALRGSDMGQQRQPLWVVALPMLDSPMLKSYALVVMLPIGRRKEVPPATSLDLHSRAVVATGLSFTLADATDPDLPLVWVNPAFTATTGYTLEESVGRNCRFLQGAGTDPADVDRIRRAVRAGEDVTCTVLNYRKDGTAYWNQVHISPVHGPEGALTHFVGIQTDVTGRIEADRARDAALLAERRARAASEAAEERLQLLVDASSGLVGATDVADAHRRLIDLLVPRVADFALVLGPSGTDDLGVLAAQHSTEKLVGDLRDVADGLAAALVAGPPVDVLVGADGGRLLTDLDTPEGSDTRRDYIADEHYLAASAAFPVRSAVLVPLPGRGPATEVLVLGRSPDRPQFTRDDVEVAADLGRRVGVLVENTRLHELQRSNSEVLQRSLLPDLPVIRGIRSAAQYHAGAVGSQVGGDFYDPHHPRRRHHRPRGRRRRRARHPRGGRDGPAARAPARLRARPRRHPVERDRTGRAAARRPPAAHDRLHAPGVPDPDAGRLGPRLVVRRAPAARRPVPRRPRRAARPDRRQRPPDRRRAPRPPRGVRDPARRHPAAGLHRRARRAPHGVPRPGSAPAAAPRAGRPRRPCRPRRAPGGAPHARFRPRRRHRPGRRPAGLAGPVAGILGHDGARPVTLRPARLRARPTSAPRPQSPPDGRGALALR